ncbi:39S ribosomal protein L40, mitochondrial [Strongyloides ratti]|uniref:Large ribosomal subunit protein mL40 n=1 Tax=Strongyloides ratti TaxID=34506 RepID=A0A090L6K5_STRRB|nr:39S ribosomal protein L40, mitochondrial [Strongyloides ratti]CEF65431.1 39S ribosomal protein L40, mitochondrial [Strongyloides ratti]
MFRITNIVPKIGNAIYLHTTPLASSSVFMKRQKRIDPEVAKQREMRKRRKLEKEIRLLKKEAKKFKPIEELSIIDEEKIKNIKERQRNLESPSKDCLKNEVILRKKYNALQNKLWRIDDTWISNTLNAQEIALERLKILSPELYASAIKIDDGIIKYNFQGPPLVQFHKEYKAPDGDFIDVTKKWC